MAKYVMKNPNLKTEAIGYFLVESFVDKKHLEIFPSFVFLFTTTPSSWRRASYINKTQSWAKSQGASYQRTTLVLST